MKKYTAIFGFFVLFLILSNPVKSDEGLSNHIFYSYESNGSDYLYFVGVGTTLKVNHSDLGMQLNTAIGNAEVLASDGYLEEYTAWEVSAKFGYFSDISIFVEGGFDLTESLFHDLRYSDYEQENGYTDDVDAFIGLGAGIKSGAIEISGFVRFREIDSEYWEAASESFSGLQIALHF